MPQTRQHFRGVTLRQRGTRDRIDAALQAGELDPRPFEGAGVEASEFWIVAPNGRYTGSTLAEIRANPLKVGAFGFGRGIATGRHPAVGFTTDALADFLGVRLGRKIEGAQPGPGDPTFDPFENPPSVEGGGANAPTIPHDELRAMSTSELLDVLRNSDSVGDRSNAQQIIMERRGEIDQAQLAPVDTSGLSPAPGAAAVSRKRRKGGSTLEQKPPGATNVPQILTDPAPPEIDVQRMTRAQQARMAADREATEAGADRRRKRALAGGLGLLALLA